MARRSSRSVPTKSVAISPSVMRGLASLVEGNEGVVASMLSLAADDRDSAACVAKLADCMGVNNLSAEALLARFFDSALLGEYCAARLGKSAKGNAATLAARIAREWAKPAFAPLSGGGGGGGGGSAATKEPPAKRARKEGGGSSSGGGGGASSGSSGDGAGAGGGAAGAAAAAAALSPGAAAVLAATTAAASGGCPIELDSLWLMVGTKAPFSANLLPVLRGAAATAEAGSGNYPAESAAYKLYKSLAIDDSDGCDETSPALFALQASCKSPAAAIEQLALRSGAAAAAAFPGGAAALGKVWAKWLKGASWKALAGDFPRAHELPNMVPKALAGGGGGGGGVRVQRYCGYLPTHPDFVESLGMEFEGDEDGSVSKGFAAQFVKVWGEGEGAPSAAAVGALVARATSLADS